MVNLFPRSASNDDGCDQTSRARFGGVLRRQFCWTGASPPFNPRPLPFWPPAHVDRRWHLPSLLTTVRFINFQDLRVELESLGHQVSIQNRYRSRPSCLCSMGSRLCSSVQWYVCFCHLGQNEAGTFYCTGPLWNQTSILYILWTDIVVCFRTESDIGHPEVPKTVDLEALLEYFTFQNIFTDKTFLRGLRIFPAGHWAKLPLGHLTNTLELHQYWDFHFQEPDHPALKKSTSRNWINFSVRPSTVNW